uniref:Uncharacterized protein n=1 Tax=Onchocerca volvulus TaxID=6282 RepID=A0A8R1XMS1_ONCVO
MIGWMDRENTRLKKYINRTLISRPVTQINESQYRNKVDPNLLSVPIPKLPENNGLCNIIYVNGTSSTSSFHVLHRYCHWFGAGWQIENQ